MAEGLNGIINQLERQKAAIERALLALWAIEGIEAAAPALAIVPAEAEPAARQEVTTRKGKKRSAAVRKRMKEAQQLRWAKIRGEPSTPAPAIPESSKPKRRISAEGMKKIIAATKKRWRLRRAAASAAK